MAKERLSKLQKWILLTCYRVSILKNRDGLKEMDFGFLNKKEIFFQEDVLFNYFNLQKDDNKVTNLKVIHFKRTSESNKAYVTLFRSLKNLEEKGLIENFTPLSAYSKQIHLTDKGIELISRYS